MLLNIQIQFLCNFFKLKKMKEFNNFNVFLKTHCNENYVFCFVYVMSMLYFYVMLYTCSYSDFFHDGGHTVYIENEVSGETMS